MKLIYHAQLHEGHAILINFDTPVVRWRLVGVGFWGFWPGRQFATVFGPLRPQFTYILGLLLDGHISPRFSLAGYPALAFYLTLLST